MIRTSYIRVFNLKTPFPLYLNIKTIYDDLKQGIHNTSIYINGRKKLRRTKGMGTVVLTII